MEPPGIINITTLTEIWLVGEVVEFDSDPPASSWKLLGVFTNPVLAEQQCLKSTQFVGPLPLNQVVDFTTDWPRARFPLRPQI